MKSLNLSLHSVGEPSGEVFVELKANRFIKIIHRAQSFANALIWQEDPQGEIVNKKSGTNPRKVRQVHNVVVLLLTTVSTVQAAFPDVDIATFTSGSTGFRLVGGASNEHFNRASRNLGDVNGDGIDDIAFGGGIGSPPGRTSAGIIMVVYGHTTATAFPEVDPATFNFGAAGFMMYGAVAGGTLGYSISAAGDVNGDGVNDIIAGAAFADPNGVSSAGVADVIFGRNSSYPFPAILDLQSFVSGNAGFKVTGAGVSDVIGKATDGGGDINGDGYDDVIIGGSAVNSLGRSDAGAAYVIFGHSMATAFTDIAAGSFISGAIGFRIYGAAANDKLGLTVGTKGDMNGDGYDDVVVSSLYATANGRTEAGVVYVIFGHSGAYTDLDMLSFTSGASGFRVLGDQTGGILGGNTAGDINGDGYDDLILGARLATYSGRTNGGIAYVIFGTSGSAGFADVDLLTMTYGTLGFRIFGAFTGDQLGYSVSGAGDVNRDGAQDILVGSTQINALGRVDCGVVLVLFGHSNLTTFQDIDTRNPLGELGYKIYGAATDDEMGSWVASAGDINADGADDFFVNAQFAAAGDLVQAGAGYVIFGSYPPPSAVPTMQSTGLSAAPTRAPTRQPTRQPTSQPSRQPSTQPSAQPSGQPETSPTSHPSSQPTSQPFSKPTGIPTPAPSISTANFARLLSSPTYRTHNGFAFAGIAADGSVHTWGEAAHGGDSTAVSLRLSSSNITAVVSSRYAFTAVDSARRFVAAWGAKASVHGASLLSSTVVSDLVANEAAFAGIAQATGGVIAFGSVHGGDVLHDVNCNGYSAQLAANVTVVTASAAAFAAVKSDGTVYAWGNVHTGAGVSSDNMPQLAGVSKVVATREAFAALLASGRVVTWGGQYAGGDSSAVASELQSGVVHIVASNTVFVAIKHDQRAVPWGYGPWGGDASAVSGQLTQVVFVAHTYSAVAVIRSDGSVVAWGDARSGGDASAVQAALVNVEKLYGNSKAFAALKVGGGVVAWGKAEFGGEIPSNKVSALSSGVVSIYHTDRAFAALKIDGSVVVWGQAGHGGSPGAVVEAHLVSGVHTICSNDVAFSVIKVDGDVVGWGHPVSIPQACVHQWNVQTYVKAFLPGSIFLLCTCK